jgi:hypothetical protein
VTIAKRPFVLGRDGEDEEVICVKSEPEYFCEWGWTGMATQPVGQNQSTESLRICQGARQTPGPQRFGDGCIAAIAAWPPCGAARVAGIVSFTI